MPDSLPVAILPINPGLGSASESSLVAWLDPSHEQRSTITQRNN